VTHIAAVPACRRYSTIRAGRGISSHSLNYPASLSFLNIAERQRDWIWQQFFSVQSVSHDSTLADMSSPAAPNLRKNHGMWVDARFLVALNVSRIDAVLRQNDFMISSRYT
jgi:hypothetical protein